MLKAVFVLLVMLQPYKLLYSQGVDRSVMPKPETEKPFAVPEYEEFSLRNGLKVYFIKTTKPTVSMRLLIGGGRIAEPLTGAADAICDMIMLGSANYSVSKFQNELELNAIELEATATDDAFVITAKGLRKNIHKLLHLTSEAVCKPAFNENIFKDYKKEILSSHIAQSSDPEKLAELGVDRVVYGESSIAGILTPELIDYMSLDDMKEIYGSNFFAKNSSIAITANISKEALRKELENSFGAWKSGEKIAYEKPKSPDFKGGDIIIIDRPNSVQSIIRAIALGTTFTDSNRAKAIVLNNILGGTSSLSNRLARNLREKNGFTYTPFSEFRINRFFGNLICGADVSNNKTAEALSEMLSEFNKIQFDTIKQEELSRFINSTIGAYIESINKPEEFLSRIQNSYLYGFPTTFYSDLIDNYRKTTPQDIMSLARDFFRLNAVSFVIVGKALEIKPQIEQISKNVLVLNKSLLPIKTGDDSKSQNTARAVWSKMLNAMGGIENLRKIKSLKTSGYVLYTSNMMAHPIKGEFVTVEVFPFNRYQMLDLKMFKIESVLNKQTGFVGEIGKNVELTEGEHKIYSSLNHIIPEAYLPESEAEPEYIGKKKISKDKFYFIIDLHYSKHDITVRYNIDGETFLPLSKQVGDSVKTKYDDWKFLPILGVQLPHTLEIIPSSKVKMNMTDIRYEANTDIDERIFFPKEK